MNSYNIGEPLSYVGTLTGQSNYSAIENVVNMGSVTFIGSTSSLYIGGIAGRLLNSSIIRNCVNYGPVTHSGVSSSDSFIGGIAGICDSSSTNYIQNCANYGPITKNNSGLNFF